MQIPSRVSVQLTELKYLNRNGLPRNSAQNRHHGSDAREPTWFTTFLFFSRTSRRRRREPYGARITYVYQRRCRKSLKNKRQKKKKKIENSNNKKNRKNSRRLAIIIIITISNTWRMFPDCFSTSTNVRPGVWIAHDWKYPSDAENIHPPYDDRFFDQGRFGEVCFRARD